MSETTDQANEYLNRPHLIAVVKRYAGPNEERPIGFVEARTKREMSEKLKAPEIAEVVSLVRGKRLPHVESRHVTF